MADIKCERCRLRITEGQFYIEARKRAGAPFIAPRPGIDNGLNLDPITYLHIPSCDVYQEANHG
ncbi:hypothetical protein [Mycobacterium sp. SMC-4]|uniref:hypothetical protein n=1 Tax=Mycobacterium sp. SMC-4 TaxID=2857059 RepID=UPI0021B4563E|nr:hypothetical protein [Mycobacterium sp. SMC-4]UXA19515.1 hypothetical protein KXD98_07920 [Mycobacterium sp. SMC-4]